MKKELIEKLDLLILERGERDFIKWWEIEQQRFEKIDQVGPP